MIESQCRSPPTEGCWHQAFGSNRARSPAANGWLHSCRVGPGTEHGFTPPALAQKLSSAAKSSPELSGMIQLCDACSHR
jgi:hypothetical protein